MIIEIHCKLTSQEESIMGVTCRMLLRLEECIEIPERALDIAISRHLGETHLEENVAELSSNL